MTTTLEDRLRDAYQAAARTVRPETIRPGVQYHRAARARSTSRSQRRFRMFAPLAAAAAVVAVIGTAIAVPHLVAGSSHPATVTAPATISAAPFMAELASSQLVIQQAGTTRVTGLISPPDGGYTWDAVAAARGTTFIAAATTFSDREYTSALYEFVLSPDGKPSHLMQLRSGIPGDISALAASQDGHRIAYVTLGLSSNVPTLSVITGTATRHWTEPLAGPGSTGLVTGSLSITADGSELGFATFTIPENGGTVRAGGTMWLLPVSSAPGSATARSHKVTTGPADSSPYETILSADGQAMYVLSSPSTEPDSAHSGRTSSVTLSAYSTADGTLLRTIHTWTGIPDTATTGTMPGNAPSMTISGSQLLVWGIGGTTAYQVDLVSGAIKPVWVYSLHQNGKYVRTQSSSIAW